MSNYSLPEASLQRLLVSDCPGHDLVLLGEVEQPLTDGERAEALGDGGDLPAGDDLVLLDCQVEAVGALSLHADQWNVRPAIVLQALDEACKISHKINQRFFATT